MHTVNIIRQAMGSVASRNSNRSFYFRPSEVADFCINKCPHKDKPCKGTCREFKNFKKNLKGEQKNAL